MLELIYASLIRANPVLGDEVMAAALIDRIRHHCLLVNIRGNSYRLREHTDLQRTLPADVEPTPSPLPQRKSSSIATS